MPGQIINRGKNTWMVRVFLGRDENGKRIYRNETAYGGRKEAELVKTRLLRERDTGLLSARAERHTIGGLLDDVMLDYKTNGKDYNWAERVIRFI
jgi:hypothetical protein